MTIQMSSAAGLRAGRADLRAAVLDGGRARARSVTAARRRCATSRSGSRLAERRVQQISNNYHNQFQLPLLFYVLVILAMDHAAGRPAVRRDGVDFRAARASRTPTFTARRTMCRRASRCSPSACSCCLSMWIIFAVRHPDRALDDARRAPLRRHRSSRRHRERAAVPPRRRSRTGAWRIASPARATAPRLRALSTTRCAAGHRPPGSWAPRRRARWCSACCARERGLDVEAIARLADGARFAPEPLERRRARAAAPP